MTFAELEIAAGNTSISDTMFFCMLLGYWRIQEVETRDSDSTCSIDSPEFEQMETERQKMIGMIANKRPAVDEMLCKHIIKEHADCCGPNAQHDEV